MLLKSRYVDDRAGKCFCRSSNRVRQDVIITMLPQGQHVRQVYTDPEKGLLAVSKSESLKLFIDCSTIDVATSNEIASLTGVSGLGSFCDAPVSGGPAAADSGNLTFMFGSSSSSTWDRAKPTLALMGKEENIFNCGSAGAGLATKLLNNYCNFVNVLALCEGETCMQQLTNDSLTSCVIAMNTGIRYGLDPKTLASKYLGQCTRIASGLLTKDLGEYLPSGLLPGIVCSLYFANRFIRRDQCQ